MLSKVVKIILIKKFTTFRFENITKVKLINNII